MHSRDPRGAGRYSYKYTHGKAALKQGPSRYHNKFFNPI
jgi:hypothetical protein